MPNHPPTPMRGLVTRILWLVLVLGVAATGCAASEVRSDTGSQESAERAARVDSTVAATATTPPTPMPSAAPTAVEEEAPVSSSTAQAVPTATVVPEPTSIYDFSETALPAAPVGVEGLGQVLPRGPKPVSVAIEDIDVVDATVIDVGVNPDLTFEVPPADQVGWYRFGPAPGEEGSAVLAAHIAFDGVDGVFRHLADVAVGSVVVVGFDDGTSQRYRIETVTEYLKDELPDELFARTGPAQLALITCGGDFNRQLSSYESNTVAVAVPI